MEKTLIPCVMSKLLDDVENSFIENEKSKYRIYYISACKSIKLLIIFDVMKLQITF